MIVTTEKKRSGLVVVLMLLNSGRAIQASNHQSRAPAFGVGRRAALRKAAACISFFGTIAPAFANDFLAEEETDEILWRAEAPPNKASTVTTLSTETEIESSKDPDPPIEERGDPENLMVGSNKANEEEKDKAEVETREVQSTMETTETTKESTPVLSETIESTDLLDLKVNGNERSKIEIVSNDVLVEVKEVTLTTDTKIDAGGGH